MPFIRRPLSLAVRLTLFFAVAAAIVFPVFGWMLSESTERHLAAEDASELAIIAGAVRDVLAEINSIDDLAKIEQRFDDILVGHHSASLFIRDRNGNVLYANPGPDVSEFAEHIAGTPDVAGTIRRWSDAEHNYRALVQPAGEFNATADGPYTLIIAVPIDNHLRFLQRFRRTLWLMVVSSIAAMGLMGWIAVRQGHAPLRRIVTKIRRISANDLDTRLSPETVPAELTELADSFNELLQRVAESIRRLSDFNADIAHELRTPIANLMTQTQVSLSKARTVDAYREILYSNLEEYERMAQMVSNMLFLAKTDNRLCVENMTRLNLAEEMRYLFDIYESWAEERGVFLALQGTAIAIADQQMLRRVFSNLLSNAIRHTPTGGTVQVMLRESADRMTHIAVENPGAEIPPEHLSKLFDRFYRIDPSRQRGGEGAGLGLAIVKSIVTAHRGEVSVTSKAGCTRFEIRLPGPALADRRLPDKAKTG